MDLLLKCLQWRGKAFQVTNKGTCSFLGTVGELGFHPSPAAVHGMATAVQFYTGALAPKFFLAGKFNQ